MELLLTDKLIDAEAAAPGRSYRLFGKTSPQLYRLVITRPQVGQSEIGALFISARSPDSV